MNRDERILHLQGRVKTLEAEVKELKAVLDTAERKRKTAATGFARLEADNEQLCLANSILADKVKKLEGSLKTISRTVDQTLFPIPS